MNNKVIYLLVLFLINIFIITAQDDNDIWPAVVREGDTIPVVYLPEIPVVTKRTWKNQREMIRYDRLQRDVRKVYPYAKKAGEILKQIDYELAQKEARKDQKDYINKLEAQLKAEFEGDIRDMTVRQGIILIKLIDREAKHTCYYLVKELKGSLSAFFWQTIAGIFGSSLKYEYDINQERDIENIIRKIEEGYYDVASK